MPPVGAKFQLIGVQSLLNYAYSEGAHYSPGNHANCATFSPRVVQFARNASIKTHMGGRGAIYNALNSNVAEKKKRRGIIQAKPTLCVRFRQFFERSLTWSKKLGACRAASRVRFSKGDNRPRGGRLKPNVWTGYAIRPNMQGGE